MPLENSFNLSGRRKAFISAPLIGTVIFLAAVLFVVNLQNIEAQASMRVANDAYHNRIASVLEEYRSDLASIFREGLSRTISFYVLNPGWDAFTWTNDPHARYYNSSFRLSGSADDKLIDGDLGSNPDPDKVSFQELKFGKCETVKAITQDVICSIPIGTGGTGDYSYGLPQWMSKFKDNYTFEGIKFTTSNINQVKVFLPNERTDVKEYDAIEQYTQYCRALLQGSIFDCREFATSTGADNKKCVDHDADTNFIPDEGPGDVKEVKGCDDGSFFVKVNVLNPALNPGGGSPIEIYDKLPRVQAEDTGGNVFRSSGIGDENFYLPISLKIFKYFEDSMKVYGKLAYGTQGSMDKDEGIKEGIADGHCGGPNENDCKNAYDNAFESDTGYSYMGKSLFKSGTDSPGEQTPVAWAVANAFYSNVFKKAVMQTGSWTPDYYGVVCNNNNCDKNVKFDEVDALTLKIMRENKLGEDPSNPKFLQPNTPQVCTSGSEYCAFYGGLKSDGSKDPLSESFELIDNTPANRVDPAEPIKFKWGIQIQHDSPGP